MLTACTGSKLACALQLDIRVAPAPRMRLLTLASTRRSAPVAAIGSDSPSWANRSGVGAAGAAVVASLLLLAGPAPAAASIAVLEGPARIVDGDTLYIGSEKVRLYAVDAPEKAQSCANSKGEPYLCGQMSFQALKEHVGNKAVHCEVKQKDQYGRNVAACGILSGRLSEDMGTWLVSNGYAVAYKQYGKDYVVMEEKAHAMHKGIWQGSFTEPAQWRKEQKAATLLRSVSSSSLPDPALLTAQAPAVTNNSQQAAATAAGAVRSYAAVAAAGQQQPPAAVAVSSNSSGAGLRCTGPLIKGNINSKGEKIYHTVNSGAYARVQIDEKDGERYFCTEQEAQAAGWRAALK